MFSVGVVFDEITCCKCHCMFAVPREMRERLIKTHEGFYCPRGHIQYYLGKSTEDKLREQILDAEKSKEYWKSRTRDWQNIAESRSNRVRAMRGVVTKIKKSIVRGNCPRCGEHFKNLAEHMKAHAKVKVVSLRLLKRNNRRNVTANV